MLDAILDSKTKRLMLDAIPNSEFQGKKERKGAGNTRKYRSSRMFHIAHISSRAAAK